MGYTHWLVGWLVNRLVGWPILWLVGQSSGLLRKARGQGGKGIMGLLYREAGYRSRFALQVNLFVYTNIVMVPGRHPGLEHRSQAP